MAGAAPRTPAFPALPLPATCLRGGGTAGIKGRRQEPHCQASCCSPGTQHLQSWASTCPLPRQPCAEPCARTAPVPTACWELGLNSYFYYFFAKSSGRGNLQTGRAGGSLPCGCVHHPASGLGWAAGPAPAPAGGLAQALASLSLCRGVLSSAAEGFEAQRGISEGGNELGGTARPGKHPLAAPAASIHHRLLGTGTCPCSVVPRARAGSGFSPPGLHLWWHA